MGQEYDDDEEYEHDDMFPEEDELDEDWVDVDDRNYTALDEADRKVQLEADEESEQESEAEPLVVGGVPEVPFDSPVAIEHAFSPAGVQGVQFGKQARRLHSDEIPALDAKRVAFACDSIVNGKDVYKNLVYLSRVRASDVRTLFEASQSYDTRRRWERLWVLMPFLARMSRLSEVRDEIVQCLEEDLTGFHLIAHYDQRTAWSVRRFFERLYSGLLPLGARLLIKYREDYTQVEMIVKILEAVETAECPLREALAAEGGGAHMEALLGMLVIRSQESVKSKGSVSARVLMKKLRTMPTRGPGE